MSETPPEPTVPPTAPTLEEVEPEGFVGKMLFYVGMFVGIASLILLFIMFVASAAMVNGIVIKTMWGWFLVPVGLPAIGLAHSVGLGIFIKYLTWTQVRKTVNKDSKRIKRAFMLAFVYPCVVLSLAGVVHLFM